MIVASGFLNFLSNGFPFKSSILALFFSFCMKRSLSPLASAQAGVTFEYLNPYSSAKFEIFDSQMGAIVRLNLFKTSICEKRSKTLG